MRSAARRRIFVVLAAIGVVLAATMGLANASQGPALAHLDGELLVAHGSTANGMPTTMQTAVRTAKGVVSFRAPATAHDQLMALAGKRVHVGGTRTATGFRAVSLAVTGAAANGVVPAAAPATMKIAVILMHLPGSSLEGKSVAQAQDVFFNQPDSVANWMSENSGGQTTVTGKVFGYYNSTLAANDCDLWDWQNAATNAARAGGMDSSYNYVVVYTPGQGCGYAGIAWVGASGVYLNGSMSPYVPEHELGHNLGVWHSGRYTCAAQTASCISDYGDGYDVMGSGGMSMPNSTIGTSGRHYNAFHKFRIGWLSASRVQNVTTGTQVVNLTAQENPLAGPIEMGMVYGQNGTKFSIEKRASVGYDAGIAGVYVRNVTGVVATDDSLQPYNMGAPLAAGQSFVDTAAKVTITTVSEGASSASVQACVGTCGAPPPSSTTTTSTSTTTTTTTTKPTTTTSSSSTTTTTIGPPPPPGSVRFVKSVVSGVLSRSGNSSMFLTVPAGSGAALGDRLVIAVGNGTFAGTRGCSDSKGNTYTVDGVSGSRNMYVCSGYVAHALVPGDTITMTYPGFSGISSAVVNEFGGLSPSALEGAAHVGASTATKTVSVSPGLATTHANDLVFVAVYNKGALLASSGFATASTLSGLSAAYQVTHAIGTYSTVGSVASGAWGAVMVAYHS